MSKPGAVHRETDRHRRAFEHWYEHDRDVKTVGEAFTVSLVTVYHWIDWFGWKAKADARDLEVERIAAKKAILRKSQMIDEHRKAGELVRRRGVEYLAQNPIEDERVAITAIEKGIAIERTAEGLPTWVVELMSMTDDELLAFISTTAGALTAGAGPADDAAPGTDDPHADP